MGVMDGVRIYLDMEPPRTTAQQKGETIGHDGRIHHYTKRRVQEAASDMSVRLMREAPVRPLTGPVYLRSVWVFARSRGKGGGWKITRPDTDNMVKLLKDVMTRCGYWDDDAQVCHEVTEKRWESAEERRGIYIEVGRLEE